MIENPTAVINPGESFQLAFGIQPSAPETYRTMLQVLVKDNPEPLQIGLTAEACVPTVEMEQTALEYDKLLLGQTKELSLSLPDDIRVIELFSRS